MFACFLLSKQKEASKEKQNKKKVKDKMEKTNYQENRIQQQEQQQKQELFDSETKRKIKDSLQEIYNKQQLQQQATNGNGNGRKGKFIKFVHDGELKRLSFTGQFQKEQVPYKDFITNQVTEGRFSERYFFECYDITDSNCFYQNHYRQQICYNELLKIYLGNNCKLYLPIELQYGVPLH